MESSIIYLIAGITVLTFALVVHHFKHKRREIEEIARRRAVAKAAQEAKDKMKAGMGRPVKTKPDFRSSHADRVPLGDAVGTTFTGAVTPSSIARWETEIHEIGRQIMGRIDSKMVAMQTLTLEANRSANRLEVLLERLEHVVKQHVAQPHVVQQPAPERETVQNGEIAPATETVTVTEDKESKNVISVDSQNAKLVSYTDILKDLELEIDDLSESAFSGSASPENVLSELDAAAPATILKAETAPPDVLSLSSPSLPGGMTTPPAVSGLDLRKQVEMMSDYGYTPRQIAQSLNITLGEVDLMLSLRG